jgi:peptidoglycan/xylan/chitin deacetylase (PgdA/CDA1 family)
VTSKVQPGSIVLFHNAALHTPEALPAIIQTLLQEGYTFVPISQIILSGEYTIDHTGRQCPA